MAMLARAAEHPQWWPHLLAIAWQALWVALILRLGAQLFRKTVLKSGPRTRWWKRKSVAFGGRLKGDDIVTLKRAIMKMRSRA